MNRYIKILFIGFVLFLGAIELYAQPSLIIGDGVAPSESNTTIDVRVMNFTGLVKIEFPVYWNPNELKFIGVSNLDAVPELQLMLSNFDISQVDNGKLVFNFEDSSEFGTTLDGNEEIKIFQIEFQALIAEGESAMVTIPNLIDEITVIRNNADKNIWEEDKNLIQNGTITATTAIPDVFFNFKPTQNKEIFCKGDQICYDLVVDEFDSILAMTLGILWNNTVLEFNNVSNFGLPRLSDNTIHVNRDTMNNYIDSIAIVAWGAETVEEFENGGISLANGSILFSICFNIIGDTNTSSTLFIDHPTTTSLELVNNDAVELDIISNEQVVTVSDCENLITITTNCQNVIKNETVCIDFTAVKFEDIEKAKFTFTWDSKLEFIQLNNFNLPNLDLNNYSISSNFITFDWTDINGATLTDGELLFTACFKSIGDIDSISTIGFIPLAGGPIGYEFINTNDESFSNPQFNGCKLTILPPKVEFSLPSASFAPEAEICIPISVKNFIDISLLEMSIQWDSKVLDFTEVNPTGLIGLNDNNFNFLNINSGQLDLTNWRSDLSSGITLIDNNSIFELCFKVIGNLGDESPISIENNEQNQIVINNISNSISSSFSITNGLITVASPGIQLNSAPQEIIKDNSFCVDISVNNFQEVIALDYAHLYDQAVLRFDSVKISGALDNLTMAEIIESTKGKIKVIWFDVNTGSTSLANGTVIYSLCFTAIGNLGDCANFTLDSSQDIQTVASAGEDAGILNAIGDICVDNFGLTLVDSIRPTCNGGDGSINLNITGDPEENFFYFVTKDGFTIESNQNVTNNRINLDNLSTGTYCITLNSITNTNKNTQKCYDLNLKESDYPKVSLGEDINVGCVGDSTLLDVTLDGSNSSTALNGGTFSREWSILGVGNIAPGLEEEEISKAISAGNYIYTITMTATNCSAADTISVFTTQPPRVEVVPGGILGCTNSTFQLSVELLDENEHQIYNWSTADGNIIGESNIFNPIIDQPGIYKFTVTDTLMGCIAADSSIIMLDIDQPNADAGPDLEMRCEDDFLALTGIGSVGAEVEWSTPDGSSIFYPNQANQEIANVTRVGTYIFTATNQVNGCQKSDTMIINADNSLPVARVEDLAIIGCDTENVKLDGSNSSQGAIFSYRWEGPNSQFISSEDTISTNISGNYLFIVTNIDNAECISDSVQIEVKEDKTVPNVSIDGILRLSCQSDCAPLTATVPAGDHYSYEWISNDGVFCEGQNTPEVLVKSIGVYKIIVTDLNNNCSIELATIVGGDGTEIFADAGPSRLIDCQNELVTLDGRGSTNTSTTVFSWKNEEGTEISSDVTAEVNEAGAYTLEIEDTATGCTASGQVSVTKDQTIPLADAGEVPTVSGCEFPSGIFLDGSNSDIGENITYAWYSTSGKVKGDTTVNSPEISGPGLFVLTVTNTTNRCFSTDEVLVQSDVIIPIANAGSDKMLNCDNPTATIAGLSEVPSGNSNINWSTLDGNIIGPTDQLSINVDAAGTYTLTITSPDGCTSTDNVFVNAELDLPEANAGQTQAIACNQPVTLNGSGTNGGNILIEWSSPSGTIFSGGNTYTPQVNRGGSYTLMVTNLDNNCTNTALVLVTDENDLPIADAGNNQEICINEATLNAIQPEENFNGNWTTLENSLIISPAEAATNVADLVEGNNTYIWTLSSEECGAFSTDTVVVNVPTLPMANDDIFEIQADQSNNLINVIQNDQVNSTDFIVSVLVQPTTGQLTETSPGVFEFTSPARYFGTQQFQYEVCSRACFDLCAVAGVRVLVLPGEGVDTTNTIPNAITPNGDGMNDMLMVDELIFDAIDFPKSELIIFNRWGDVVYRASPYNNDWRGTSTSGEILPEGTYYYVLRLDTSEGEVMKGDITILR